MNIRGFDLESSSPVQQIMAGNPNNWWNNLNMNHHESQQQQQQQQHPSFFPQYTPSSSSSSLMLPPLHDNNQQDLPADHSWSQLLLGGLVGHEEDRSGLMSNLHHQLAAAKKLENWEEHVLYSTTAPPTDVKHEVAESSYLYRHGNEDFQAPRPTWSPIMSTASSPRSCVTNNMLDFSYTNSDCSGHHQPDNSSDQCKTTTTGGASKKAKTQPCPNQSTFKVRKEKMSDRITTLHQLVSPFGKTDTASVLLEVIGYIRFLQSQIEALSLPYLGRGSSGNMRHQQQSLLNEISLKRRTNSDQDPDEDESKKDLRSRGLCLVPVNFTLHLGGSTIDSSADYWAPALGGGFQ